MIHTHSIQKKRTKNFLFLLFFMSFSINFLYAENFILLHSAYDKESYNIKFSIFDTQNNIKIGEYSSMVLQSSNIHQHDQKIFMNLPFDQKLIEFNLNDISAFPIEYPIIPGLSNFTITQNKLFFLSQTHNAISVYALPSIDFLGNINTKYKPLAITSNNDMIFTSNNQENSIDFIEVFNAKTHFSSSIHNLTDYNPDNAWITSLNAFDDCLLSLTNEGTQLIGLPFKPFETKTHYLNETLFCLKRFENDLYGLSASKKIIYKIENGHLIEKVSSNQEIDDFCVIDFEIRKIEITQSKTATEQTGSCNIL